MSRAAELSRSFVKDQPARAARALDQIPAADVAAFIAALSDVEVADVISRMQPSHAAAVLEQLAPERAASLLHHAPSYTRAILMRALTPAAQKTILKAAPRRQATALSRYLSYDPGTVGAWMEVRSASFAPDTRVDECLRRLRALGNRLDSSLFVVDGERRLLGSVELNTLLGAEDEEIVKNIMQRDIPTIAPQASLASVVSLKAWDSTLALPVTDGRHRLVGSLRFDALREGLDLEQGSAGGLHLNMVVMHIAQAFLISLSGLLQVATSQARLSRLSGDPDQR